MSIEVEHKKGFGICVVDESVAELIQLRESESKAEQQNGLSVDAIDELKELKAKYSDLFENPDSLPPVTKQIVKFIAAVVPDE